MIPLTLWIRIGAVALLAGLAFALYSMFATHYKDAGRAEVQARWDREKSEQKTAYIAALEKVRSLEGQLERTKTDALNARTSERAQSERTVARIDGDRQRLRDQIATYAAGASAAEDSFAAARQRAETLGELLDRALQAHRDRALEAELLAADVRALLAAWPTVESVKGSP